MVDRGGSVGSQQQSSGTAVYQTVYAHEGFSRTELSSLQRAAARSRTLTDPRLAHRIAGERAGRSSFGVSHQYPEVLVGRRRSVPTAGMARCVSARSHCIAVRAAELFGVTESRSPRETRYRSVDRQVADLPRPAAPVAEATRRSATGCGGKPLGAERLDYDRRRRDRTRTLSASAPRADRTAIGKADPRGCVAGFGPLCRDPDRARSGRRLDGRALQRLGAGADHIDLVAPGSEKRRHRSLNRHLIVDEENSRGPAHDTGSAAAAAALIGAGTAMLNRAPPSGQFSAEIRPCSAASIPRAIDSPIPVPDTQRFASAPR